MPGYQPKIIAYWLGWLPEVPQEKYPDLYQVYHHLVGLPQYVDVVVLAFAIVQEGRIWPGYSRTLPCSKGPILPTCLFYNDPANPPAKDDAHTFENLKNWVGRAKAANPHLKFLLSIGGDSFNDWLSIPATDAGIETFADSIAAEIARWNAHAISPRLIDGIDIDYEYQTCGQLFGSESDMLDRVIRKVSSRLGHGLLSMPVYDNSPPDLKKWLPGLREQVTWATTMNYSGPTGSYTEYKDQVNWLAMGFGTDFPSTPICQSMRSVTPPAPAGMLWNLGNKTQTAQMLAAIDDTLRGRPCEEEP